MDGHKGKQPEIKPAKTPAASEKSGHSLHGPKNNIIIDSEQQPLKVNLQTKVYAKRSVNVISPMQENTILISVGGKKARCLVDTGAQISIASLEFLKKTSINVSSLKPADIHEIVGVGNEHHAVLGTLEIPISISGINTLQLLCFGTPSTCCHFGNGLIRTTQSSN